MKLCEIEDVAVMHVVAAIIAWRIVKIEQKEINGACRTGLIIVLVLVIDPEIVSVEIDIKNQKKKAAVQILQFEQADLMQTTMIQAEKEVIFLEEDILADVLMMKIHGDEMEMVEDEETDLIILEDVELEPMILVDEVWERQALKHNLHNKQMKHLINLINNLNQWLTNVILWTLMKRQILN